MAKHTLAQHEQHLKSLEYALKEIGDQHKQVHDILSVVQANVHEACSNINVSWSKVVNLFVTCDHLRSTQQAFKEEGQ